MVAGEMMITDPVVLGWLQEHVAGIELEGDVPRLYGASLELTCGAAGAAMVVVWGLLLAKRHEAAARVASGEKTQAGNS
jgi:hypothetical protein